MNGLLSDVALNHVLAQPLSKRFPAGVRAADYSGSFRNGFTTVQVWCQWFSATAEGAPGIYDNEWVIANEQKIAEAFALCDRLYPD